MLLAMFLFMYLKRSFDTEKSNLVKEVGYIFSNTIQEKEGAMLSNIILKQTELLKNRDSVKVITFVSDGTKLDSNFHTKMQNSVSLSNDMIVKINRDSIMKDANFSKGKLTLIDTTFKIKFNNKLREAEINPSMKIIEIKAMTKSDSSSNFYYDKYTDTNYELKIEDYFSKVFFKIWPDILFSLGVFLSIWLAFRYNQKVYDREQKIALAKNDFVQNMTHELKTPIATTSVALEALKNFDAINNIEKRKEYLDISQNEVKRLASLVDRVLTLSILDEEKLSLEYEKVNTTTIINEVLDAHKLNLENKKFEVSKQFSNTEEDLYTDKNLFQIILFNLIENAIKYNNSSQPKLGIKVETSSNVYRLYVIDNGCPIPNSESEKIFDKFYRIPQGNIHNVKGHGLGLSHVKYAVTALGGTIKWMSGEGNTFEVSLPKKHTI